MPIPREVKRPPILYFVRMAQKSFPTDFNTQRYTKQIKISERIKKCNVFLLQVLVVEVLFRFVGFQTGSRRLRKTPFETAKPRPSSK